MTPDPCPHCAAGRAVQLRLAERIYECYEIFCRLAAKGKKATVTTDENWPNPANESRAKLYAACVAAGVNPDGKWLSEAAVEAIEKLTAARPANDGEPVTPDLLIGLGYATSKNGPTRFYDDYLTLKPGPNGTWGVWAWSMNSDSTPRLVVIENRGDLRRLRAALGVPPWACRRRRPTHDG